jgi:hypothetical protein
MPWIGRRVTARRIFNVLTIVTNVTNVTNVIIKNFYHIQKSPCNPAYKLTNLADLAERKI